MPEPLPGRPHPQDGQRQPLPGWPVVEPAEVELAEERQPMALYADPHGPGFVAVPAADLEVLRAATIAALQLPAPQRTGIDPRAQIILASGIATGAAGAGVGWGIGQIAAGGGSTLLLLVCLIALLKLRTGAARGGDTYNITNHNRWWGRSHTRT